MNLRQKNIYRIPYGKIWGPDALRLKKLARSLPNQKKEGNQIWEKALSTSMEKVISRRAREWQIQYPTLPILESRQDIEKKLLEHQVILVTAGTGSGKSTQLPKFCLDMGLSSSGRIGITQPRRLAAHTIAARLEQETGKQNLVGCQTRFVREIPADADIKVMTDGILLQEFRKDPWLTEYQTLIIDEVHERNLNIDVMMGMLKRLINRRKELKIILSSATMESGMLAAFFDDAPVIEAGGRTYPVQIEYMEPQEGAFDTVLESTIDAILELQTRKPDNLLAFLPTERDIHEVRRMLERHLDDNFIILPLFSRLSPAEQAFVFKNQPKTKIILSTNIAETSVTIPGIAYVVDSGLARISRYYRANRIQGLPIEPISQASANQRAGRAGRTKPGTCIRLFSKDDFANRPEHTEPEIKRSNLANVALQLLALNIKDLETFPLPSPPQPGQFRTALKLLDALGAVTMTDEDTRLTPDGYRLSTIPLDVTLGKMIISAKKEHVLEQALPVIAAVSLQDPKILPSDELEKSKAKGKHARFSNQKSDILAKLNLYVWIQKNWQEAGETLNKLRKLCVTNYLHFIRVREWFELTRQLQRQWPVNSGQSKSKPNKSDALHRAILSGLPGQVALFNPEKNVYKLSGGKEVILFPGSGLKRAKPPWVASVLIRETSRTFLTDVFTIDPQWIEKLWPQACKRSYFQAQFNPGTGYVEARETVSYMGLILPHARRVQYQRINPEASSRIFWTEAIVEGMARTTPDFHRRNLKLLEELTQMEEALQQNINLPYPEEIAEHYISVAPDVTSIQSLEKWLQTHNDEKLWLRRKDYMQAALDQRKCLVKGEVSDKDLPTHLYPTYVETCGYAVRIKYGWRTDDVHAGIHLYPNHGSLLTALDPPEWWALIPGILWNVLDSFKSNNPGLLDWEKHFESLLENMNLQFRTTSHQPVFPVPPEAYPKQLIPMPTAQCSEVPEDVYYSFSGYTKQHLTSLSDLILNALNTLHPPCSRAVNWPNHWPKSTTLHIHYKVPNQKDQLAVIPPTFTSLHYWLSLKGRKNIPWSNSKQGIQDKSCKPFGGIHVNWFYNQSHNTGGFYCHPLEQQWHLAQLSHKKGSKGIKKGKSGETPMPSQILWAVFEASIPEPDRTYLHGYWKSWEKKLANLPITPEIKKRYTQLTSKPVTKRVSLKTYKGRRTMKHFEDLGNIPFEKPAQPKPINLGNNPTHLLLAWCITWGPDFFKEVFDRWFRMPQTFHRSTELIAAVRHRLHSRFHWALAARVWSSGENQSQTDFELIDYIHNTHEQLAHRLQKLCDYPEWHVLKKTEFWKQNEPIIKQFRKTMADDKNLVFEKIQTHVSLTCKILDFNREQHISKLNEPFGFGKPKSVKVSESALERLKERFGRV